MNRVFKNFMLIDQWPPRVQANPDVQGILDWIEAVDAAWGPHAAPSSTLSAATLRAQLPSHASSPEALKTVLMDAAQTLPLVDTLKLLVDAAECYPETLAQALNLALPERDTLRYAVFYWLLLARWLDVQRLYSVARLEELRTVLAAARAQRIDGNDD